MNVKLEGSHLYRTAGPGSRPGMKTPTPPAPDLERAQLIGELWNRARRAFTSRSKVHVDVKWEENQLRFVVENLRRSLPMGRHLGDMIGEIIGSPPKLDPVEIARIAVGLRACDGRKHRGTTEAYLPDAISLVAFASAMIRSLEWPILLESTDGMTLREALDATGLQKRTFVDWIKKIAPDFLEDPAWAVAETTGSIPVDLVAEVHRASTAARQSRAKKARAKRENSS